MNKAGFGGLNQNFNGDNRSEDIFGQLETLKSQFISARVTDIIISNTHPLFDENGGWSSIGTIFFESIDNLGNSTNTTSNPVATPLLPYIKNYPLVNELVLLFNLPGKNISKSTNSTNVLQYYYLNPIAVWNHPHHNAYPNLIDSIENASQDINYEQIENGIVRGVSSVTSGIELNSPLTNKDSFIEKTNIHPLLPFAGDNIYEGRWGNSIRFGSTVPPISVSGSSNTPEYQNNWSFVGENGDPITILRNGQPKDSSDAGWLPIIENIREDLSSIYMTSYQQIPLRASSENYSALNPSPLLPREFFNPQIILNSNRLILNASSDSILASAQDSISLSSNKQIGFTSENINISSPNIKIGGTTANEPALLGGSFIEQFSILVDQIQVLSVALNGLEGYDLTATNIETSGIDLAAQSLISVCKNIKNLLPKDGKITSPLLSNSIRLK
tara:strand:- start:8872 stop:10206 length:1335 start_codon:yes stop_codon:yes gene_type:complete